MKAAQIMSVVLPEAAAGDDVRGIYRAAFARLLDQVPPMPIETVLQVLIAELGKDAREMFAELRPDPVGVASIGQVHQARLRDGRRVAVKVQYPGAQEAIRADLANAELVATFLRLLFAATPGIRRWDTVGIAREVSERIGEELDYRTEALHQREFAQAYRGHPFIRIPEVIPELSGRRVLTMDFAEGLDYKQATAEPDRDLRDRWGEAVFRFTLAGSQRLGMLNADANPGNFVFHPEGTITCLDFGCIRRLTDPDNRLLWGFYELAEARDADGLFRWSESIGYLHQDRLPAPEELLAYYREGFGFLLSREPFTVTPQYMAHAIHTQLSRSGRFTAAARSILLPPAMTMVLRISFGLLGILSGLRATAPWRTILDESKPGAPPATPLGELDIPHWMAQQP